VRFVPHGQLISWFSLCRGVGLTALTVFFMRVRIEGLTTADVVSGFAIAGYGDVAAKVSVAALQRPD
jgi:hypothetical protein